MTETPHTYMNTYIYTDIYTYTHMHVYTTFMHAYIFSGYLLSNDQIHNTLPFLFKDLKLKCVFIWLLTICTSDSHFPTTLHALEIYLINKIYKGRCLVSWSYLVLLASNTSVIS